MCVYIYIYIYTHLFSKLLHVIHPMYIYQMYSRGVRSCCVAPNVFARQARDENPCSRLIAIVVIMLIATVTVVIMKIAIVTVVIMILAIVTVVIVILAIVAVVIMIIAIVTVVIIIIVIVVVINKW